MKLTEVSIKNLQDDSNYIILDNPFSSPKFVKLLSKTEYGIAKTDTYSLKLFAELLSRINLELLDNKTKINQIVVEINVKNFLDDIGVKHNDGYRLVIGAANYLQKLNIQWKENKTLMSSVFVSVSEHNLNTGKINLYVPYQFAKRILEVGMKQNFSYLKQNLFKLNNSQAIKLYPFFKQWQNKGIYDTDLERFKEQFSFNTSGYNSFGKFKEKVLNPATKEINEKTDITISFETRGENLQSLRPRVRGLIFTIKSKDNKNNILIIDEPISKQIIDTNEVSQTVSKARNKNIVEELNAEKKELEASKKQVSSDDLSASKIDEIVKLFQKINFAEGLHNTIGYDQVLSWIKANDYESVHSTLQYHIDKQTKIKSLGFFYSEGIWQQFKNYVKEKNGIKSTNQAKPLKKVMSSQEFRIRKEWYEKLVNEYHEGLFQKWSSHIDSMDNDHLVNEIKRLDLLHKDYRLSSLYAISDEGLVTWKKLGGHYVGKSMIGQLLLTGKIKEASENTIDANNWIKASKGLTIATEKECFIITSALG